MPTTYTTRIRRVLLDIAESENATPENRMEAARLLKEMAEGNQPLKKPNSKRKSGLLG